MDGKIGHQQEMIKIMALSEIECGVWGTLFTGVIGLLHRDIGACIYL